MGLSVSRDPYFAQENHTYYCCIQDNKGNMFVGKARCHPDDQEFESEKIGYTIAMRRSIVKVLKHYIKNEIKPKLKAFQDLYKSMQTSSHFNYKSYEARRIYKEMKNIEADLETFQEMILTVEEDLKQYLESKELFHKKIRDMRQKGKNK